MYKLLLKGYAIECSTLDELRAAVGEFAGQIERVEEVRAPKPVAARAPTTAGARNKAGGPTKSWEMARWYGQKKGINHTIARTELADMRRDDFETYRKLEAEFLETNG